MENRRVNAISSYEFLLCLFVIFIHVSSEGVTFGNKTGLFSGVLFYINRSVTFAVPAFIFASALKLTLKFKETKLTYRYILRRITKIYLPYILWVTIYYIYFVTNKYFTFNLQSLIIYILNGTLAAHFYFVVIIMQFYILMPVMLLIAKRVKPFTGLAIAFTLTWSYRFFIPYDSNVFNFLPVDRFFTEYLFYWIAGVYCALNYQAFTKYTEKYKKGIFLCCSAILLIHINLSYLSYTGAYNYSKYTSTMHLIYCMFMVIGFYVFCMQHLNKFNKFLYEVGKTTYYVYLSHVLVLLMVENYLIKPEYWLIHRFIMKMIFVYIIPFAGAYIYVLMKKKFSKKPHDLVKQPDEVHSIPEMVGTSSNFEK